MTPERKALAELVACKDMKDRLSSDSYLPPETRVQLEREYQSRRDPAWSEARRALSAPETPAREEGRQTDDYGGCESCGRKGGRHDRLCAANANNMAIAATGWNGAADAAQEGGTGPSRLEKGEVSCREAARPSAEEAQPDTGASDTRATQSCQSELEPTVVARDKDRSGQSFPEEALPVAQEPCPRCEGSGVDPFPDNFPPCFRCGGSRSTAEAPLQARDSVTSGDVINAVAEQFRWLEQETSGNIRQTVRAIDAAIRALKEKQP